MVPGSEHQAAREFSSGFRPQLSVPVERKRAAKEKKIFVVNRVASLIP
jgi:hypothetical protein